MSGEWWSWPFQITTGLAAGGAIWALWVRRYQLARLLAGVQVTLIVLGWAISHYPFIVVPDLTITNTAAPDSVLQPVLIALVTGAVVLVPSFIYLYSIFKGEPTQPQME